MMKLTTIAAAAIAFTASGALMAAGNQAATQNSTTGASASTTGSAAGSRMDSSATSASPSSIERAGGSQAYGAASAQGHSATLVRSAQQALKQHGFDTGAMDGQMGPSTQSALREFQQAKGLPASGDLDAQTLAALGVAEDGAATGSRPSQDRGSMGQGSAPMQGTAPAQGTVQRESPGSATRAITPSK
jgi:peptidoglycan hydrolase-like protein with peptidoglycan-binding domain